MGANISRRGLFGHAAGAYVLISGIAVGGISASVLHNLISRHRALDAVWVDAAHASEMEKTAEAAALDMQAYEERQVALEEILKYRPSSLEENAERLRYLKATEWNGTAPCDWQMELLIESLAA